MCAGNLQFGQVDFAEQDCFLGGDPGIVRPRGSFHDLRSEKNIEWQTVPACR